MKKVMLVALMVVASVAFASSLSIPYFVDNAPAGSKFPPNTGANATSLGQTCVVYLHNNQNSVVTCSIDYFNQDGTPAAYPAGVSNTFTLPPLATIPFRPVMSDPAQSIGGIPGGLEFAEGMLIPNKPNDTTYPFDNAGSAVVQWVGAKTKVNGVVTMGMFSPTTNQTASYGYLFPDAIGPDAP